MIYKLPKVLIRNVIEKDNHVIFITQSEDYKIVRVTVNRKLFGMITKRKPIKGDNVCFYFNEDKTAVIGFERV